MNANFQIGVLAWKYAYILRPQDPLCLSPWLRWVEIPMKTLTKILCHLHNLLPPPREHPSITRSSPLKISSHPTRTKKYQSFFSHALSQKKSDFIIVFFSLYLLCFFLCLFSTILFSLWLLGLLSINDIWSYYNATNINNTVHNKL